ncbi:MAG: hypothetical protein ACI8ZO_001534 [Flavobacteriales bacterium]|jgi:hypothetical protein
MIKLIKFPVIQDRRGDLCFLEEPNYIPFKIDAIFYISNRDSFYEVIKTMKSNIFIMICLHGEIEIQVKNENERYKLSNCYDGLHGIMEDVDEIGLYSETDFGLLLISPIPN